MMLTRGLLMVLFMLAVGVIGCQQRPEKDRAKPCPDCPFADAPYSQKCKKCGAQWCSSSPDDDIGSCPNCPLDVCPETADLIIAIGSLRELVQHQPDKQEYRKQLSTCETRLQSHLDKCLKCRDALQAH